jgi:radical SAM protein with 4Fe4S-binding SPASM domain
MAMSLSEATLQNLRRKSAYVDKVQLVYGVPLFSWLDLSLTELCNRSAGHPNACTFCPRIDPNFYPNQNLHLSIKLAHRIADELADLKYQGVVVLCGFGEPLLHPGVVDIVRLFNCRVEIVTNGDTLGPAKITKLVEAGTDYFVVSLYDGPHQVPKMQANFRDAGYGPEWYLLRDRWHKEVDQFGLKLTNRAGTVTVGPQDPVDVTRPCHYTTYQLTIDWNGDVLLCPQDWHKKLKFGNVNSESLLDIWTSKRMHKRRLELMAGRRQSHPCKGCNTDGTLHGFEHVKAWQQQAPLLGQEQDKEAVG